jgi:glycosyltransferase involved in cell wall biosynthesis
MRFTIVTPSFRGSRWLKLCVASVADQDIEHEHIVQDSCSDDGTRDWLPRDPRVTAVIEKDQGMYDAVNRGLRRGRGELMAYLNCDEQYLPGALRQVSGFFDRHPEVDVVFANAVVVDDRGDYVCERRPLIPQKLHTVVSLSLSFLTAATFLRRRVFERHQVYFDPTLRVVGDADWTLRLLRSGVRMAILNGFTSAFAETGQNLSLKPEASRESREFSQRVPWWTRRLAPAVVLHFRLRRWLAGHYRCRPHDYAIYTQDSPAERKTFKVDRPTYRWKRPPAAQG